MHSDLRGYYKFTSPARLDKAMNSLIGIIEGISVDFEINKAELDFLNIWLESHQELSDRHPFNELFPVVRNAIADQVLTIEEKDDILWLCEKLRSKNFYDTTTADIQRLHAVLAGIIADGIITVAELQGLSGWLQDHEHLKTCWPYEEVSSLVTAVLSDKQIDDEEQSFLKEFFAEFVSILDSRTIIRPKFSTNGSLSGLCAVCPEITFPNHVFCLTGTSFKYTRSNFSILIKELGGNVVDNVSTKLNYLIIGGDGNPCWSYACYGRKVEKAVELRKSGARLMLVHENDFHDAVADL